MSWNPILHLSARLPPHKCSLRPHLRLRDHRLLLRICGFLLRGSGCNGIRHTTRGSLWCLLFRSVDARLVFVRVNNRR